MEDNTPKASLNENSPQHASSVHPNQGSRARLTHHTITRNTNNVSSGGGSSGGEDGCGGYIVLFVCIIIGILVFSMF